MSNYMEKMKVVNDLTVDISGKLGGLTKLGALSASDAVIIIRTLSDSQYKWMESNFTQDQILEFSKTVLNR